MDIVNIYWVLLLLLCFGKTQSTEDGDSECKCKNGGQCMSTQDIEICICDPPYVGPTCEEDLCHPNPCKNNHNCSLTWNSFSCNCNEGYSGDTCDQILDLCESTTCRSGETCKFVSSKAICIQEISTSSTSTTEKLPNITPDEPRTTKENSESTIANKDNTDTETQSSNEQTFTKRTNGSTPNTELDEYSRITEEYLSNSSLVSSTVNLVVATDTIDYENASSTIYTFITNTTFDEFDKLSTESDVSSVTDDISTEGATSAHLQTTAEEFNTTTENSESTNDSKFNTTTEPQSTETTSDDSISSNEINSIGTTTEDSKTTIENTSSTSDNEDVTTKESPSPDTTSDGSIISSNAPSSVGTMTDGLKTTTENTSSTSDNADLTTNWSLSPDTTSDDSISSKRPSSFGTTTANSNINTENLYSTISKDINTTPASLTSETTQSVSSTNTGDTVTEVEIDKKKAHKPNVAYICGGIGGGLGTIFFIVGLIYYLKRLKKRKNLLYFKSGDTSSMGSSDSTSHLA